MVTNYAATVAYDGTEYSGFQIQRDRRTVQGELESTLNNLTRQPTRIHGSGRTDAGVHARGQVISFRSEWRHGADEFGRAMNATVRRDISVRDVRQVGEQFHARFSAVRRVYIYNLYEGPIRDPLLERYALHCRQPLDVAGMNRAAELLVGEKDCAAFGQPPSGNVTVRRIYSAQWSRRDEIVPDRPGLSFRIEANAFLRGMVRRIVGTLLHVGQGLLDPSGVAEILDSRDIGRACPPAAARGLCLWHVEYE